MSEEKDESSDNNIFKEGHWDAIDVVKTPTSEEGGGDAPKRRSYWSVLAEPISIAIILLILIMVVIPIIILLL